jgi:glyoxylase-like metal-dependent hydrolase (beta-lactamase superfamily II)
MTAPLPLEDNFNDIINKALRGLGLSESDAAHQAGVAPDRIHSLREGKFDEATARRLAPVIGVGADSLAALGKGAYKPAAVELDGLAQFTTPFDDMTVNSYVVWSSVTGEAIAFDTGADCTGMLDLLREKSLKLRAIFITHTHGDHIFDLDRFASQTGASAFVGEREPLDGAESFAAGRSWDFGSLHVDTRLTWGHSKGGITYVVTGLAKPIAVVGDSIFAGSMGGGGVSYAEALKNNKEQILTLSDDTVICPGHGPMTTVREEKVNNPFFTA